MTRSTRAEATTAEMTAAKMTGPRHDPLRPLLGPALERDPGSLRRLLDAVAPDVVRVIVVVVGSSSSVEVDDLAQEALLGFVQALPKFRGDCTLKRFARRVGARTAATHLRRSSRKATHHGRWVERERGTLIPTGSEPDVHQREALRALLRTLPEAQAQTLVLRVVLGCSIREIAEETGAPPNTVRSRLRLAKDALRRRLEEDPTFTESLEVPS